MFDGSLILPIELRHGTPSGIGLGITGLLDLRVAMRKSEHVFPRYARQRTFG